MAEEQQQVEASHVERSEGRLSRAVELAAGSMGEDGEVPVALVEAQVHATLAAAEQLERLNSKIDGANFGDQLSGFFESLHSSLNEIVWRATGGGK